jgi:hypothetical protein
LSALAANPESKGATLTIHLHYTGSGTVGAVHKLYVAPRDSPDFVKDNTGSVQSFAVAPVMSKSGVARFEDIQKNPVYVSGLTTRPGHGGLKASRRLPLLSAFMQSSREC